MATIDPIVHPYPDFEDGDIINPEQFDANNQATRDKVNEIIVELNTNVAKDGEYLATDNTTPFTPDQPYEPATKKYVDDNDAITLVSANSYTDSQVSGVEVGASKLHVGVTVGSTISITTGGSFPYIDGTYIQFIADADISAPVTVDIDGGITLTAKDTSGVDIDVKINTVYLASFQDDSPDYFLLSPNVLTDDIESDITDIETKTDFITVTQNVSLDDMESDVDDLNERGLPLEITDSFIIYLAINYYFIMANKATLMTVTVPPNTDVAFPIGSEITVVQTGLGVVDFAEGIGVTIQSINGNLTLLGKYAAATLKKVDTDTWVLIGALIA